MKNENLYLNHCFIFFLIKNPNIFVFSGGYIFFYNLLLWAKNPADVVPTEP